MFLLFQGRSKNHEKVNLAKDHSSLLLPLLLVILNLANSCVLVRFALDGNDDDAIVSSVCRSVITHVILLRMMEMPSHLREIRPQK